MAGVSLHAKHLRTVRLQERNKILLGMPRSPEWRATCFKGSDDDRPDRTSPSGESVRDLVCWGKSWSLIFVLHFQFSSNLRVIGDSCNAFEKALRLQWLISPSFKSLIPPLVHFACLLFLFNKYLCQGIYVFFLLLDSFVVLCNRLVVSTEFELWGSNVI